MLAIMPQNSSGRSVITCGPGVMPWIIIAPTISAMTGLDGMPSVSTGMNEVCAPALLADSGPATPSMAPLPKRDGSLAIFFSRVYAAKDASTAPPPGRMPSAEPRPVPRRTAFQESLRSSLVGNRLPIGAMTAIAFVAIFQVGDDVDRSRNTHGHHDETDAVGELRQPEGEAELTGIDVGADQAEQQAQQDHAEGLDQ